MKMAVPVARILLGLLFLVFGLNGFLLFLPQPPLPPGDMLTFVTVMGKSHYMMPGLRGAGDRRAVVAHWQIRATGADSTCAGDREHPDYAYCVSARRAAAGRSCGDTLVDPLLRLSSILRGDICRRTRSRLFSLFLSGGFLFRGRRGFWLLLPVALFRRAVSF